MSPDARQQHQPWHKRLQGWQANLLLMIAALLVAGIAGEIIVRLIRGDRMVLFPRYHSKAVYGDYVLRRLRPNTVFWHTSVDGHWRFSTNAKGFREDRDIPYAKVPARLRVLAVGDSQTEGFEVRQEYTFSSVIENRLNARGASADVINAGISGFGTAEALAFLEHEGIKYRPDVVVYGFYANDFDDNVRSGLYSLRDGVLISSSKVYVPAVRILDPLNSIPPMRWLSEHSYLYSLAFNAVWDWFKAASIGRARSSAPDQHEYATPVDGPNQYEMALTTALLSRMSQFCRTHGILFVVIDVPVRVAKGVGNFSSSIPTPLLGVFRSAADVLVLSDDVLGTYRGLADIHVAHGQNHISEFSHLMLGLRAADGILDRKGGCITRSSLPGGQAGASVPAPGTLIESGADSFCATVTMAPANQK